MSICLWAPPVVQATAAELRARVAEEAARLRQQQAAYEGVRSERNAASRSLIDAQDDAAEMRRKTDSLVRALLSAQRLAPHALCRALTENTYSSWHPHSPLERILLAVQLLCIPAQVCNRFPGR